MKKMLCYMLSSIFLLAILSACESSDDTLETRPMPTLADLAGKFAGNSRLNLTFVSPTNPLPVTSGKKADGASVEYKNQETDNLVITLTDARLSAEGGLPVSVGGEFTFTISDLLRHLDAVDGEIGYKIGNEGSASITVGSGAAIDLTLTEVSVSDRNTKRK